MIFVDCALAKGIFMSDSTSPKTKHAVIYDHLHTAIAKRQFMPGDQLPTEYELVEQFGVSRPTVTRALRDLQSRGLVERKAGAGTFVKHSANPSKQMFGLLIPELGRTEIFEPICGGIAREAQGKQHTLAWGDFGTDDADGRIRQAEHVCHDYIERGVAGVFYAPVEIAKGKDLANQRIVDLLHGAQIPVVLLDRDIATYPKRSDCDLVGIDNFLGGYIITQHLIKSGAKRIGFLSRPGAAPTADRRAAGYRDALVHTERASGESQGDACWADGDAEDAAFVEAFVKENQLDAIVCVNDLTAAHLMHTLNDIGMDVPGDVRVAGFDDVKYAKLMRVPLTTVHQPCDDIAKLAVSTMLERIANPKLPARSIQVAPRVVVRKSCGSRG
jgi:GntR family transcriptional regulator, arabinose operon transcriptional repressor